MSVHIRNFLFLLIYLAFSTPKQTFAQAISFSPSRIFFKGSPGETISETITLSNSSKQSYEFVQTLKDWKRDSLGGKIYFPMGTLPNSNANNISLSETNFSLRPGEQKSFLVYIKIPAAGQTVSTNSMLFFTQTNPREATVEGKLAIGIKVSLELGVQLFYTPDNAKPGEMDFVAFEYEDKKTDSPKNNRLGVKFANTGDFNRDGFIRFELTNKQTGEEIKLKPISIAIMPHSTQWTYCQLNETLPEGEYLAVAILDTGENNNLKVAEKEIHVKE